MALPAAAAHLRHRAMHVTQQWLAGCVEFFCEEHNGSAYNENALFEMVTNQWILGDLRDISPGCLPPGLCDQVKITLNGIYTLQMNSIIDIGTPAYQQLQKIQKIDTNNLEVNDTPNHQEITSQRILKMTLTDGVQIISGLEYKPMRNLNTNLTPGIKLQIKGPVDCRRGVLMLEEKHVTILGGEVDDLLEPNNYKNILINIIENNMNPSAPSYTREKTICRIPPPVESRPRSNVNVVRPNNTIELDDVRRDIEMFNDDNFDLSELENIESRAIVQTASYNNTSQSNDVLNSRTVQNNLNDFIDLDAIITDETEVSDDDMESTSTATNKVYPIKVDKSPYVYIKQLVDTQNQPKLDNVYIVKAQIIQVVGKLTLQNKSWVLKCKLCDGSESLDVDFSSAFLSPMIGYTPEEMMKLKKQMSSRPELKQKLLDGLENAMNEIKNLDCLFHIAYKNSGPCVTRTEILNAHHIAQLKARLSNVN